VPIRRFTVDDAGAGRRADLVLAAALGISRRAAQALLESGQVHSGGVLVRKGQLLGLGEEIEVQPPGEPLLPDPEAILPVIFADAALIVVDKPAGMPTHPLRPDERGTAANALVARFPELAGVGAPREGGVVHRLDTGTSGLLCFARTAAAYETLRAEFRFGRVEKSYLALCLGEPPDEGGCDLPIGRGERGASKARVVASPHGARAREALPAETRFRVVTRFRSFALLDVQARTGRMHQVRIHLAHLGYPLAGDALYQSATESARDTTGLARPFLHAARLRVRHPLSGEMVSFESPLPADLRRVLAAIPPA
jgi:23S rRNA pseudouridine1911/1915/1917 synthase